MLKFIGFMAILCLLFIGLVVLFQSKPPKREIFIIQDYEITDVLEQGEESSLTREDSKEASQQ